MSELLAFKQLAKIRLQNVKKTGYNVKGVGIETGHRIS